MRALFNDCWKPELLVYLADMDAAEAARGCFAPHIPQKPYTTLSDLWQVYPQARKAFAALSGQTPFERMLVLFARECEPEALELLLGMGEERINVLPSSITRDLLLFLTERLRRLPLPDLDTIPLFLLICRKLHMLITCSGTFIPHLPHLCFWARAQARRINDEGETALFDLLIGMLNLSNTSHHNNPQFHAIMTRGKNTLEALGRPELLEAATPYLGVFHFLEGDYDQAMNIFARLSRQLRAQKQHLFEMFYARHWSFAAANRGNLELAANLLLSRLRQLSIHNDASLVRSIRSQLAALYLRMGKHEKALEQLDIALSSLTEQSDITSAVTTLRHLAYYHLLEGNPEAAYKVLKPLLQKAELQGYQRPTYLGGYLLELLEAFDKQGFSPLPCYCFTQELSRCLSGPNRLLHGVALRVQGHLLERNGDKKQAELFYQRSISIFDASHNSIEADKTRLSLARMLAPEHEETATLLVNEAWGTYPYLKKVFWPPSLLRLIPAYMRSGNDDFVSTRSLIEAYRDSFTPQRQGTSFEDFSRTMLAESGRILGVENSYLYHQPLPFSPLRCIAQRGASSQESSFSTLANMDEIVEIVIEGTPVVLENTSAGQKSMLIGIPIDCRPYGSYALLHMGTFRDDVRPILEEELLRDIGRVLAWSCTLVLGTDLVAKQQHAATEEYSEMICVDPVMQAFLADIDMAAKTDASILLNGESGVGKEMLAQRIHKKSGRSGRLVTINMASLQDSLFESEFFGHEKGAFTGALNSKIGLVELAENGTLFLDELTEASSRVQAKLLRVLQERSFMRVGGTRPININFRLVAASNSHMGDAVREGRFRSDLYYRVAVIYLKVPPLRLRKKDILPLARYYLHYFARRHNRDCVSDFSELNCRNLEQWGWPGNIRELRNTIEQSVILSGGTLLSFHGDLYQQYSPETAIPDSPFTPCSITVSQSSKASLQEVEKKHIAEVLTQTQWRIDGKNGALSILQISRSALYAKIRKYDLAKNSSA